MENNEMTQNLYLSVPDVDCLVEVTNNRAQYYSDLAKKYKDEAKEFKELAKNYAEQNSDVTLEYINELEADLQSQINTKQTLGDYALNSAIPTNVSQLVNDSEYITKDVNNLTNYLPLTGGNLSGDLGIIKDNNTFRHLRTVDSGLDILSNPAEVRRGFRIVNFDLNNKWLASVQSDYTTTGISRITIATDNYTTEGVETGSKSLIIQQSREGQFNLVANGQTMRYVVDAYENGTSGWRLWSDGWCEQWGVVPQTTANQLQTITLLKTYSNTDYFVIKSTQYPNSASIDATYDATADVKGTKTTSSFGTFALKNSMWSKIYWKTEGYIA